MGELGFGGWGEGADRRSFWESERSSGGVGAWVGGWGEGVGRSWVGLRLELGRRARMVGAFGSRSFSGVGAWVKLELGLVAGAKVLVEGSRSLGGSLSGLGWSWSLGGVGAWVGLGWSLGGA